jgi:hypothetical protein
MLQGPFDGLRALRLLVAVAAVALAGCGNPAQEVPRHATSTRTHAKQPMRVPDSRANVTSATWYDQQAQTDLFLAWYAAACDDPNPMPRLQLIEGWAQQARPDSSLDLLTNALVDPDEMVRARAQELLERVRVAKAEAK